MLPYTEPLQQSSGQQLLLRQRIIEEQHGFLLQGGSVQQLHTCDEAEGHEPQRYDDTHSVLLHGEAHPQQAVQLGGEYPLQQTTLQQQQPLMLQQQQQQQQRSPEDEQWHQRAFSEQQQRGQAAITEELRGPRHQLQQVQQEAGVEQQLVQQYLAALKSDENEPLLQQMGEFLCRWQQRHQQEQQSLEGNQGLENLENQLRQSQTYDQQVQQFLLQQLNKQQHSHGSQQEGQQQVHPLKPEELVLLHQQQPSGLPLDSLTLKQQSPGQQPRPQQQQRPEAHRAKRRLQTPSRGSPTPLASATTTLAGAGQQQHQREDGSPPQKKQLHPQHQQPNRRRQQPQQQDRGVDMGRRIVSSSPAALLCASNQATQEVAAATAAVGEDAVARDAAVGGSGAGLVELAAKTATAAAVDGFSNRQLHRKRGVRSGSSKTSRGMQQRQQQRQQQRPQRQHRQQQQRQQRQQQRQQVARGSPSPTRGRPGGQRFDFLKSATYSGTNMLLAAGGEAAAAPTERKGSAGGGRPLWSPEGGSGVSSCGGTAPSSGVLLQQQTPQRVLQQQQLALLQQHQHPHDQHARHGTYGIVARGVRERLKSRSDADSAAAATAAAGDAGDSSTSTPASTAAGGRRGKHCRAALLQNMRGDRPYVCLSCKYRDPFLTLSPDQLEVTGHKGWSSVLATHCAEKGRWYFEVEILHCETSKLRFLGYSPDAPPPVIHPRWRVGWACRYQKYDIPIGCNQFSFALTETSEGLQLVAEGLKRPLPAAAEGGLGGADEPTHTKDRDIIGCFLELQEPKSWQPDPRKDHKLYEFLQEHAGVGKNIFVIYEAAARYFRQGYNDWWRLPTHVLNLHIVPDQHGKEDTRRGAQFALEFRLQLFDPSGILCNPEAPPPLVIDEGAWIEFSVNGKRLGRAFQKEIGSGAYHPSISLYMGAKLRFNPGPEFAFPPDVSERFQACSGMRRPYIL